MGIKIRESFSLITPESLEQGDYAETGWIDEAGTDYSFRELVVLLAHCHPSSSFAHQGLWASDPEYGNGTRDFYEKGISEERSYHPVSARDSRWFNKACQHAGIL